MSNPYSGYGSGGGGYGQQNPYGGQQGGYNNGGQQGGYGNAGPPAGYNNNGGGGGGGGYGSGYGAGRQGGYGAEPEMEMQNASQNSYGGGSYGRPGAGAAPAANRPPGGGFGARPNGGGLPSRPSAGSIPARPTPSVGPYPDKREEDALPAMPLRGGGESETDNILNDCTAINETIDDLEGRLQDFKRLQSQILSDRAQISQLDSSSANIMAAYRNLAARMKKVKSNPNSGAPMNAPQVGRVDRRLKSAMNDFQRIESEFRAQMREQQARQYRIVNPNATEAEVREVVEDSSVQVFQQALLNSNRQGQSQSALNAVRARHAAIQNIEQTMMELAELFQDLDNIVMQQDVQVKQIETKAEEIHEDVSQGNKELDTGIKSARAARKKKWICLFICVFVVIAVIVAVVVYFLINKKSSPAAAPVATVTAAAAAAGPTPTAAHRLARRIEYGGYGGVA